MSFNEFQLECLEEHNQLRAKHGCPPLKLDRNMCNYAQEWAQQLATRDKFIPRTNCLYGESLYTSPIVDVDGRTVVRHWYHEIVPDLNASILTNLIISDPKNSKQVIWRSSERMGVAKANKDDKTYVVAYYDPPGNVEGEYEHNVPAVFKN